MRRLSAPVLFLLGLLLLGAVGGITYGVAVVAGVTAEDDDAATVGPPTTGASGDGQPGLAANQLAVTGVATDIAVEGVRFDPLPTPLEITTPERGFSAGAELVGVAVDGEDATVTWDAGRPFELRSGGAIAVGLVNVFLSPGGALVGFPDDARHRFTPGHYALATPVGVFSGNGLGESHDNGIEFDATDASTVSFTGGASTPVPVVERSFEGPGHVVLRGAGLSVRRPDGTTSAASSIELPPDSAFTLHVVPLLDGSGWTVDALLQGEVVVTP